MKSPLDVLNLYPPHDSTLRGVFKTRRASRGPKPFLIAGNTTLTWDAFHAEAARLASAFHARGVKHGDRVAIMARNHTGHVLTLFAAARLGAVMVPVNPDFGTEEARYVLAHAEVSGILAYEDMLNESYPKDSFTPKAAFLRH